MAAGGGATTAYICVVQNYRLEVTPTTKLRTQCVKVAVVSDPAGNIKPTKAKSSGRIDGIVASIMAVGRATLYDEAHGRSVYEDRGVLML